MAVLINQHIRKMRGGAQSQLMRALDDHFYVVKFKNNPQGARVLANEWLATSLARRIGLPVAAPAVVRVESFLIQKTTALHVELGARRIPCEPGLQFGSKYVVHPMNGEVVDYMPDAMLDEVHIRNLSVFAGALAFDKWTCNADNRQVVYWRRLRERRYSSCLIDQGDCFGADEWRFRDAPLRGAFPQTVVYRSVTGWGVFEGWLECIKSIHERELIEIAKQIPPEWYGDDWGDLERLLADLMQRRSVTPYLIEEFRRSSRNPFPGWKRCWV